MIKQVLLKNLLASKRWTIAEVRIAQAGAKTAPKKKGLAGDGYTLGWTAGGAEVQVRYDGDKKRFTYELRGYTADGSDLSLTAPKEGALS